MCGGPVSDWVASEKKETLQTRGGNDEKQSLSRKQEEERARKSIRVFFGEHIPLQPPVVTTFI